MDGCSAFAPASWSAPRSPPWCCWSARSTARSRFAAAAFVAVVLLALTWLRLRGRWAFEWLGAAMRFAGRRHAARVADAPTALLEFVAPGARIEQAELAGDPAAVIVDGHGLTAVLELGDPTGLLAEDRSTAAVAGRAAARRPAPSTRRAASSCC